MSCRLMARKPVFVVGILAVGWTVSLCCKAADDRAIEWKAGVAIQVITPKTPMWMAGYAARNKPSEGKIHDLHAKALALEDSGGTQLLIITLDLVSVPRQLHDSLVAQIQQQWRIPPERIVIGASHTHCGPELRMGKAALYGLPPERVQQAKQYMTELQKTLLTLAGRAIGAKSPAELRYTHGRAGFAMNRRLPTENGIQNRPYPDGLVDHDVPVLRVSSPDHKLRAVLFGYACHATTLGFYQFCGDYPGFAQQYIEQSHPGAVALFLAGCGGDQNPQPRRTLVLAEQHGRALANGVEAALIARDRPVHGPLRAAIAEVKLPFATPPSRESLQQQAKSKNQYERRHAEALLKQLSTDGTLRTDYPYLVQVVRFGDDLIMIDLSGEVVVDYSLRLKSEIDDRPVWVAAYTNDVFGYVPSLRVLKEGGYEGGGAMRYTDLPGPFAPPVESIIVDTVHRLLRETAPSIAYRGTLE